MIVDQAHYPLATLILLACERPLEQRVRLLGLACRESDRRALAHRIPVIPHVPA